MTCIIDIVLNYYKESILLPCNGFFYIIIKIFVHPVFKPVLYNMGTPSL